jgi:hypothetical protein
MQTLDTPNIVLPLASSYNERGVAGYTHTVTNSEDQRKINCFYEPVKNAVTGKGTLVLSKRPGVTIDTTTSGSITQTAYLVYRFAGTSGLPAFNTIINVDSSVIQSTAGSRTKTILSSASYLPEFVDSTSISQVPYAVVQLRKTSSPYGQRIFYAEADKLSIVGFAWTEITDADFASEDFRIGKMEHIDGFAFIMDTNGAIWNSDTNSLANWTASSFITKQIKQDTIVGLARLKNQLLAFGSQTVEVFYNAGNSTGSPLGRIVTLSEQTGLVSPPGTLTGSTHYYATIGNSIYFVGRQAGGDGGAGFFMYDGQNFMKVSTVYIDKILSEEYASFYSVNSIGFLGKIAVTICFSAPGVSPQKWLIYFPEWKEWFEWNSSVFSPVNDRGFHLGLSTAQNRVYSFVASDNWQDDGTSYAWNTQFRLPTNGSQRKFMLMYGVDADTDTSTNDLTVELSTDDSKTFTTLGTIDQTQDRKVLLRGGSFRKGHIRLGNTNARPTRIQNFLARIE